MVPDAWKLKTQILMTTGSVKDVRLSLIPLPTEATKLLRTPRRLRLVALPAGASGLVVVKFTLLIIALLPINEVAAPNGLKVNGRADALLVALGAVTVSAVT